MPLWRRAVHDVRRSAFRERYSPGVERLAVLLMVPTSVLWAAAQIRAFGQVVSAVSDVEVSIAITAAAASSSFTPSRAACSRTCTPISCRASASSSVSSCCSLAVGNAHGGVGELVASIDPARPRALSDGHATPLEILEAWAVPVCGSLLAVEMLSRILGCKTAATARNATLSAPASTHGRAHPVVLGLAGPSSLTEPRRARTARALLAEEHRSTFLYVLFAGASDLGRFSRPSTAACSPRALARLAQPHRAAQAHADGPAKDLTARIGVARVRRRRLCHCALRQAAIYELVATASAFGSAGIFIVGHVRLVQPPSAAP